VGPYIVRRLLMFPPLLLVGAALVFFMLRVVPGDPVRAALGPEATDEEVQTLTHSLGWDDPLPLQFLRWLGDLARGDLGESLVSQQSISHQIATRLPATMEIFVLAMLFSTALGVSFGVISAVYRNRLLDHSVRLVSVASLSVPSFFALTLLIVLPSQWWNYVPPLTYVPIWEDPATNLQMFLPPVMILSLEMSAALMRYTRSVSIDVLSQDYIRTARAKGLRESRVVVGHMLKNTSIPVLTILGARVAGLLSGTVILEQVMSISGIGQFTYQSVLSRDYAAVQSLAVYFGVLVMISHLLVDISYALVDPRIRYR
jgi:peptide/nickel transport system permease protein